MARPELIVKHVYGWSEGYRLALRPGFCLLGNRAGLDWLAGHLAARAKGIDEAAAYDPAAPDAAEDLWESAPWNRRLSDELHLTLGGYADRHRRRVLPALNISTASRLAGPPTEQWCRLAGEMTEWLGGRMAGVLLSAADRELLAAEFDRLAVAAADAARQVRSGHGAAAREEPGEPAGGK